MKNRPFSEPLSELTQVGSFLGTPIMVKGRTWFPLAELGTWGVMTWLSGRHHNQRTFLERFGIGGLKTLVFLGSEWCHNIAHAITARWIRKPMDALRIVYGMPLVIYENPEDPSVTPMQHILRSLGGPIFNMGALCIAWLWQRFSTPGSISHEVANTAVEMNTFLSFFSLTPVPMIDGGPVLKWSLVERGLTPPQADNAVKQANLVAAGGLGVAAGVSFRKRRKGWGIIMGLFALICLGVAIDRRK